MENIKIEKFFVFIQILVICTTSCGFFISASHFNKVNIEINELKKIQEEQEKKNNIKFEEYEEYFEIVAQNQEYLLRLYKSY